MVINKKVSACVMANLEGNIKLLVRKLDCWRVKVCATGRAEEILQSG